MARVVEDFTRRADLDDPAQVHDGDPVRQVAHDGQVVRDEQQGQTQLFAELAEQIQDLRLHRYVECRYGFVRNEQVRVQRECGGDGHALLLAAGQFVRTAVREVRG